ncbi:hypothetical protein CHH58_16125 [Terribacillus saccharophilus]|uniref:XtrA/YqaO family protein n=1 Tax=Terribacillus saccharophilus TaxID=361277 RepID=UPI000BA6473B|nr:XtrA/YqaO family protein [Terribacillus saccharophilus]PAF35581.1 hypothetical protein CHH58_16125 [Terribacillus saccharophilus]
MRLKQIDINLRHGAMSLDIPAKYGGIPFCIIYGSGKAKILELPAHGETKIITHQGKLKRVRFEEGEDF